LFNSIALPPAVLGLIVVVSLVISKYFQKPVVFFLIVILASILYQRKTNRENQRTDNFEETLINVSKFIIVTGILGYLAIRIMGFILPGFD
jgi:hypothetical protein